MSKMARSRKRRLREVTVEVGRQEATVTAETILRAFISLTLFSRTITLTPSETMAKSVGQRRTAVDTIVLHAIGGPECDKDRRVVFRGVGGTARGWKRYFEQHESLGIHWIVDRSGTTLPSTPENEVANHALGFNEISIGIELVNNSDGRDPFPKRQIDALTILVRDIRSRWHIAADHIRRHSDIDKGRRLPCGVARKVDPGAAFPLQEFLESVR
jgi:N-acetyl-anhydromuramyl-L-alanine amidase AmpD